MRKTYRLCFRIIMMMLLPTCSAIRGQEAASISVPQVPDAVILSVTGQHYPALTQALSTVGFRVREISAKSYPALERGRPSILIIPANEGQQLDPALVKIILHDLEGGLRLIVNGFTPLTAKLGIKPTGERSHIKEYDWSPYAKDSVRLPARLTYYSFTAGSTLRVLAADSPRDAPLVVSGSRGTGRFIYSAIPLEPQEGMVFQYLPFLAQAIVDELHVSPTLGADNLCVYVDLGGEPKNDPSLIVAQLKEWSVREIHLGAFYQSETFLAYLPRFLAAAHQQGIAVYAWLEYPMVSQEFWDQHPEWREVTASGHRAIMDWRLNMALENPACFQAVEDLTRRLVLGYDWDGVDFAELYFEADRNIFSHPKDFTPMHPTFRSMFQDRYGVDPVKMFDTHSPYYGPRDPALRNELKNFRVELITGLTEKFMEVLADCRTEKPYLRTTLTFIDALRDPTVTERYGVDPNRLLALQQKYGFGVEIEDPYTVWNSAPDRYRAIGEYYRPRLQPGTPFTLDVNVVDRTPPGRPLNRARGLELYELVAYVAPNVDLVTLYAYSTLSADDMRLVSYVLAAPQLNLEFTKDGVVTAERQLYWHADTRDQTVYLDGQPWPCHSETQVLIPAGVHRVSAEPQSGDPAQDALRIENINGAILSAKQAGPHVTLTYESRGRCYVSLNRAPAMVLCDGAPGIAKVLSNAGRACLVLPEGKHTVDLK